MFNQSSAINNEGKQVPMFSKLFQLWLLITSTSKLAQPTSTKMQLFLIYWLINSGCEAKDSQKRGLNHWTSQEPHGEKTRNEGSVLDVGRKIPENYSRENPRNQVGTENPIHIVPPTGFEPGSHTWNARQDTSTPTIPLIITLIEYCLNISSNSPSVLIDVIRSCDG